jgi:hypothetical protein
MIQTVDENKRLPLPEAKPGDAFEVEAQGDGRFLLTRVELPRQKPTPEQVKKALDNWRSKSTMTWEELRAMTREI